MSDLKPFVLDFDLLTGRCDSGKVQPSCRRVSNLLTQFADEEAAKKLIAEGDPLLYEFYELELPEEPGVLRFGSTRLYPGKVGNEYFMTKGHFHTILDTSEIYYTLSGHGMMMMETPEGDVDCKEMNPGDALYVPATQLDLVSKYIGSGGEDAPVRLNKLGGDQWQKAKARAKAAAKDLAKGLIQLYAARKRLPGFAFAADSPWQKEFEESFPYAETDDQLRCIA